jgi:hypothetical protein
MSEAELRSYSDRYPQLQIRDPDEPELLVAWKGNTQLPLWFVADGLVAYQVAWTYPLTNLESQLKTDLCSGAKYVDLNLVGDSELAGAAVWLNGKRLGEFSRSGTFTWDVPLGVHELRIETASGGSWSTELRYDESSSGHHRIPISAADFSRSLQGDTAAEDVASRGRARGTPRRGSGRRATRGATGGRW